jgi:hypothetical protein
MLDFLDLGSLRLKINAGQAQKLPTFLELANLTARDDEVKPLFRNTRSGMTVALIHSAFICFIIFQLHASLDALPPTTKDYPTTVRRRRRATDYRTGLQLVRPAL